MNRYPRNARRAIAASSAVCLSVCLTACTGSSSSATPDGSSAVAVPTPTGGPATSSTSSTGSASAHQSAHVSSSRSGNPTQTSRPTSTALSTIPTVPVTTLPAKPLTSPASFGTGVKVAISSITHGKDTDTGRGAFHGHPTVVFHLVLSNGSSRKVDVDNVQVNATYGGSDTPAVEAVNTSKPFNGSVATGGRARGVYAFAVPPSGQGRVDVTVTYQQGVPTVLLRGSAR